MILPIKAQRLYITELDETMAESVHINSLDEDNRRFVPDEVFETLDDAREIVSALMGYYARKDAPLVYPIVLNDGLNIGYVQAVPIKNGWEIGYHIAKAHTGKGYATEAVNAFLPPIMEHLGISTISGICDAENMASRKVLEKCGFALEYCGEGDYQGEKRGICRYRYALGD